MMGLVKSRAPQNLHRMGYSVGTYEAMIGPSYPPLSLSPRNAHRRSVRMKSMSKTKDRFVRWVPRPSKPAPYRLVLENIREFSSRTHRDMHRTGDPLCFSRALPTETKGLPLPPAPPPPSPLCGFQDLTEASFRFT